MIPLRYGLANAIMVAGIAAVAWGGWPVWLVLAAIYLMGGPVDETVGDTTDTSGSAARWFCDVNLYLTLPLILVLTFVTLRSLDAPAVWERKWDVAAAIYLSGTCCAMFGATVAHELTHRPGRLAQLSAQALLALMFNSSFTIFHVHGHHRYVGMLRDPATARRGEHVFAFLARTVAGQWTEAWQHEATRLRAAGRSSWDWGNRVLTGQFLSVVYVLAAAAIAGWPGVIILFVIAAIGRVIHEAVNYVQHYGLVRLEGTPIGVRHTWDSHRTLSNIMHYNLPRHADHHLNASKPYWTLAPAPQAPRLPHGYMTMVLLALVPPLWQRSMTPLLADWDRTLASEAERAEIRRRGWQPLR